MIGSILFEQLLFLATGETLASESHQSGLETIREGVCILLTKEVQLIQSGQIRVSFRVTPRMSTNFDTIKIKSKKTLFC